MNNPGSILKLWAKAVKTHETGKDPKTLSKKGQDQKNKIKKGLTSLKIKGVTVLAAPANGEKFILLRNNVGKVMTRYCRYLKSAKDEDKKLLPKFLKTVTQLTALVLKLDPRNLSQDEQDPSLESLAGVDVAAVEAAMAAPDTDEEVNLDLEDEPPASPPTPPAPASTAQAAPPPPQAKDAASDQAAKFKTRLQALMVRIQQAEAAGAPGAAQAKARVAAAAQLGAKKQYDQANPLLDQAEQLLGKAAVASNGKADPYKDRYLGLMTTLPGDLERLRKQNAAAANGIEPIVTAANGLANKGDYQKAFTYLNQAALAIAKVPAAAPRANPLAAEWKAKLTASTPAIKTALAAGGPNVAAVAQLLTQASALARPGGDLAAALVKLTECHDLATAKQAADPKEQAPKSSIELWNRTKDQVDADINRWCDYLRKTAEKPCLEAAGKLAQAMDLFKVDLTSSLMNIDAAGGEQRKLLYPKVCAVLDKYKQSVLADRLLTAAEKNPFVPVNAKKPLLTALHRIQKHLAAQVGA